MKYKSLTEYFKDNQQLEFHDCLDYYGKFKDEILDSNGNITSFTSRGFRRISI